MNPIKMEFDYKEERDFSVKRIGLVVKRDRKAINKADELEEWLSVRGVQVFRKENTVSKEHMESKKESAAPDNLFCLFVLGGDGTFLSAVRWIGDQNVPVLGVKFGEIGFLAATTEDNLFAAAQSILENRFVTEERMRLQVTVVREGKIIINETVLNDVVINKGALAQLAQIETYIDEQFLTTYRADGLIVATPTGSTAYSLAAGGPIIHPTVPAIIMTPICPFTLTNRPLITSDSVSIGIRLDKKSSDIMLTVDGQAGFKLAAGDRIDVKKARQPVHMITISDQPYFDVLKAKLRWSGGRG